MGVEKLDHYLVRTTDLARAVKFYGDALGLVAGYRPPFRFPGAWLYAAPQPDETAGKAIVHLAAIDPGNAAAAADYLGDRGQAGNPGTGALDHVAFAASGIADMRERLRRHEIPFRERRVPDMALHQVFIHDPDGVTIELNYAHPDDLAQ
jgi:catechol 2,3-dioxygenase-like lactoylglutathione lyase family enzyme